MSNLTRARQIVGSNVRGDRQKDDYYATPPHATQALLDVETFDGSIYEPCCGEGHIAKVLEENGYDVESADLIDRGYGNVNLDFLLEHDKRQNIITNPPFSLALDFAEKALDLGVKKLAILVRLQFLEGVKRGELFKVHPPKNIYVFSKRLSFNVSGEFQSGGVMAFAWFVFGNNVKGSTTVSWI